MTAMPGPATLAPRKATSSIADSERRDARRTTVPVGVVIAAVAFVACLAAIPPEMIDFPVTLAVNTLADRSAVLDRGMHALTSIDLLQGIVFVAMLWYLWFENPQRDTRAHLLVGAVAASSAGALSRCLQIVLPTHLRPLHTAALGFVRPMGVDPNVLNHFYSFPSDHGALLFGLALVIYAANKRLGIAAFAWAVVVDVARVYEGFHYPSDIVGALGLAVAVICLFRNQWFGRIGSILAAKADTSPAAFYAFAFVISYQIATLFDDVREIGRATVHIVLHHDVFGG